MMQAAVLQIMRTWARCPLHVLVEQEFTLSKRARFNDKVRQLLRDGIGIESPNAFGKTPLLRAAEVGNLTAVHELIRLGASKTRRTMDGWTALHLASGNGHNAVVSEVQFACRANPPHL